jgi:DNA repair protein RadC
MNSHHAFAHSRIAESMPGHLRARSEEQAPYLVQPVGDEDSIVAQALAILDRRMSKGQPMQAPATVKAYFSVRARDLEHEEFSVLFLDTQHRVIECTSMFRGTLSQASVYPREVVKVALGFNAAAVVFSHNHPSGNPEPSRADEMLTQTLKAALSMVDVRVLDHIIVGGGSAVSMAERGLI